jgi:hypothetical protein
MYSFDESGQMIDGNAQRPSDSEKLYSEICLKLRRKSVWTFLNEFIP